MPHSQTGKQRLNYSKHQHEIRAIGLKPLEIPKWKLSTEE